MSKRRERFAWIAVAFAFGWPMHVAAQAGQGTDEDAQAASIIEKADRVRFPAEGFEVSVTITTITPAGPQEPRKYRVPRFDLLRCPLRYRASERRRALRGRLGLFQPPFNGNAGGI